MVTAQDVQRLRQATGAGMMDAKRALTEANGDLEKAKQVLLEQGLADARKRSDRTQGQGTIGQYVHVQADRPILGVLVELASETDFVAKSDEFRAAANDIAMHVAAARPRWVQRGQVPEDSIAEASKLFAAQAIEQGKPPEVAEKIVAGKLGSFFTDNVLYEQQFVNPEKYDGTVEAMLEHLTARLGEKITIGAIARVALGEE